MPPLSTHFRFATLLLPSLGIQSNAGCFFLGTTAPDAFMPDSPTSFSRHHFKKEDGLIDLSNFIQATNFIAQPADDPAWSFTCGYFSHLWQDVFSIQNSERLSIKKPEGMPEEDIRKLVRKEAEIINAPYVLETGHLPFSWPENLLLPTGLEFVDLERCVDLLYEVVEQSREWSVAVPDFQLIGRAEYAAYLEEAARLFMKEIQAGV